MTKASDLLVAALENEGVERIFGIPGEENLDFVESLRTSSIQLVLTRHEQAAAFMAATHGRLTGQPGVCLSTLGPGALNFTTGAAYALLGAMPMVMITGQKAIKSARQARFQIVDIVATMRPLTKLTRQDRFGGIDSDHRARCVSRCRRRTVRARCIWNYPRTSRTSQPTHRRCRSISSNGPSRLASAIERAAAMILAAHSPIIMLGAAANRPAPRRCAVEFRAPHEHAVLQYANGQRRRDRCSEFYLGTAALSERDYIHDAIDRSDLIIAIGHDTLKNRRS